MMPSSEDIERLLQEGWRKAQGIVESGVSFVQDSWNRIPFVASVEAVTQLAGEPHDETHYFLIPYRLSEDGYTLYSTRRLPEGYAAANDLPKRRVFHLPGPGGEKVLERLIADQCRRQKQQELQQQTSPAEEENDFAVRLSSLADEIDRHSQRVTGGVIIIGGLVALANPLVGVGIAAKALFPSVGGMLTREGLKTLGGKFSSWRKSREQRERIAAVEAALKEHEESKRRIPVYSLTNPLLATLQVALDTSEFEYDPLLQFDFSEFEELSDAQGRAGVDATGTAKETPRQENTITTHEWLTLSATSVVAVYSELLDKDPNDDELKAAALGPEDLRWLRTLRGFLQ